MRKTLSVILVAISVFCNVPLTSLPAAQYSKKAAVNAAMVKNPGEISGIKIDGSKVCLKPNKIGLARINQERRKKGL